MPRGDIQPVIGIPMYDVDLGLNADHEVDSNILTVTPDNSGGVSIHIMDHSTATGEEDPIIYIERQNGQYVVRIWADILQEDPTHKIVLSGARVERYKETKVNRAPSQTHEYEKKDA